MNATLRHQGFLLRRIEVETSEGRFQVTYEGTGMGFEQVLVDGAVACRKDSWVWFEPWFEFSLGSQPALLEVRVWAWLGIRSLKLTVAGQTVYCE